MDKVFKRIKENAVIRFWISYMVILLLISMGCIVGMHRAFIIVREDLVEKNADMMVQGMNQMDNRLSNIYISGIKQSLSPNLRLLGQMHSVGDSGYYTAVRAVLKEYADLIRYLDTTFYVSDTFIYLNRMDSILYENSVYNKDIFQLSADRWELGAEEWGELCEGDDTTPFYYSLHSGDIFYVFPCMDSIQNKERIGTIFWKVGRAEFLEQFRFLENYSSYSLFIYKKGVCLLEEDGLDCRNMLDTTFFAQEGIYSFGDWIVIAMQSEREPDMVYTLILPQQEATEKLQALQMYIWFLLLGAAIVGVVMAYLFAVHSGKPINMIAAILNNRDMDSAYVDLRKIRDRVEQIVLEQQNNQKELRKAFFHNLLKANFLSESEMRYMASGAGVQLSGECYYAAAIRIFPQIDGESIDKQTVEEARALQVLIMEQMTELHHLSVWSYKKNTLTTLYIIEEGNKDELVRLLTELITWLRSCFRADARWGVGSLCSDLMYFWKSAEEAMMALEADAPDSPVMFYSKIQNLGDSYYLPYTVEDHLMQGLRAGNETEVMRTLDMIEQENFVSRRVSHRQFLRLNRDICDILAEHMKLWENQEEKLIGLSATISAGKGEHFLYFSHLKELCGEICRQSVTQRSRKHEEKVSAIIGFLEESYWDSNVGLSMASEKFRISESYLSLIFKEQTGMTFGDYLEKIRIERACGLLKDGVLVTVVAEKTGYNSVQSFRRAFKRVMQVSPSEYRT